MDADMTAYRNSIRPAAGSGAEAYTLTVTDEVELHNGIAWTADLFRDGVRIGTVEDAGNGGAPGVYFDTADERAAWSRVLQAAYSTPLAEENLIAHLDFTAQGI